MSPKSLTPDLSVAPQLSLGDIEEAAELGFRTIIDNRPDDEEAGQPEAEVLAAHARRLGMEFVHQPIVPGQIGDADVEAFGRTMLGCAKPVLAFCRTGTRSTTLWALAHKDQQPPADILLTAKAAGYDLSALLPKLERGSRPHDVVIVGGGSAGIATAASLLRRRPGLDVVIVEPRDRHFYQPGWTMVGGGIFDPSSTCRREADVIPSGANWVKGAVATFDPERNRVTLEDGAALSYRTLIVAPGNVLDWNAVDGLEATLGRHGVTSNYSYETAPYTWELVQDLREGVALFTQPPMPIKCAGAPQKAMYLSCDHWKRTGRLGNIDVAFHNAGAALFGVKEYVPPLMRYIDDYGIDLRLESKLIAVDGPARRATFATKAGEITRDFDMLHVCPPQKAPEFLARSPLADQAGYTEVDPATMRHVRYENIFGLGDGGSTPNAKTAAAARKQAPIVAVNLLAVLDGKAPPAVYDGYGSCPLTVERGRIVLAEFGYGGKLLPSFPKWMIDGQKPQRLSWWLKGQALPWIYWNGMLKGHEWLAKPLLADVA
ncbi:bifunctional protein tyrosine phosphatase family protein/NAD(P)/FAD-dependent oxidoreductase [Sphingomonas sp.]|uniref:bifunctional protein tyrosine phosphatase family protein/NAD(P)/FAD-dependent oxidoreductase n=1 Tax=Sphingomonas sp. TaxID=28214 RepID=UPI000DB8897D|nr:bifunctional protein tyrosine phosphatase family protein/NAD(P)/FAD-dependent oxidoreductase [Sphingomonas sp.]PZU09917.1 MAG: TIGR01244 family phosphatase [Sphingomonas sp.]